MDRDRLGVREKSNHYCFPILCMMLGREKIENLHVNWINTMKVTRKDTRRMKWLDMWKCIEWNIVSWMYVITKLILPRDNFINLKIQVKVCFPKLLRNILEMRILWENLDIKYRRKCQCSYCRDPNLEEIV